jgi:carboxylate-amine ligase
LLDLAKGELVPFPDLLDEMLELVAQDAEALECQREMAHLSKLVVRGTSAHRQSEVYAKARKAGADQKEALREVVRFLIEETVRDAA